MTEIYRGKFLGASFRIAPTFNTYHFISKPESLSVDKSRKAKPNFAFVQPCKIVGGIGEMSKSGFTFSVESITSDTLCELEDSILSRGPF